MHLCFATDEDKINFINQNNYAFSDLCFIYE